MTSSANISLWIFCTLIKALDPLGKDISGDNQVGLTNEFLKNPIIVRVIDDKGRGVANAVVNFSILQEPQENKTLNKITIITPKIAYTDQDGYAKARVKLGNAQSDYYLIAQHEHTLLTFHFVALRKNWLLIMVFSIIGGMALFIFGLNYGSKGLIRSTGAKTRNLLFNLTARRFVALLSGFITTVIFGSCTATASLLIKFASAGIVDLLPALAVMLGANIGATITTQLLAFNIMDYALLIITVGVFLRILFSNLRNIAQFILGFGLLFLSLRIISSGVTYIKYLPVFSGIIDYLSHNLSWAIVVGIVCSLIFRSSTAVIGLILAFTFESEMSLRSAMALVLGANLGATIFPLFISDSSYARRVTLGNLLFKLIGVIICLLLIDHIEKFLIIIGGGAPRYVVNFHTGFNIIIAIIFIPLLVPFSNLTKILVAKTKEEILSTKRLDPSFLDTPAIGLGQAMREVLDMADKTVKMLDDAIKVFDKKDIVLRKAVMQSDDEIDKIEEMITQYLSKLNTEEMDQHLQTTQIGMLTITAELEHIGDIISKNLMNYAKKQIDEGMEFSTEGFSQIKELHSFVLDTLRMAISSLTTRDKSLAKETVKRRDVGLESAKNFEVKHLERLHRGLKESIETSTIHLDILSDLERINFHATEISSVVANLL